MLSKYLPNELLATVIVLLLFNIQSINSTSSNDQVFSYKFKESRFKRDTSVDKSPLSSDKFNQTGSDYGAFPNEPSTDDLKNKTEGPDHHVYYNVTYYFAPNTPIEKYWIDMRNNKNAVKHDMLSNAHRRAATIRLPFKFPFYGYKIENITIATGGFLFLGEAVHTWLAATQYIAPLMANFNTSIHADSAIYYLDNKNADEFVIQWDNVYLQGATINGSTADGKPTRDAIDKPFSFQVNLRSNGDIIFAYKQIPYLVSKINEEKHPVKVGISDAYIIDRTIFFIRRKTIYEYHKAELKQKEISNGTVIFFKALPTCNIYTDCNSCVVHSKLNSTFECSWCEASKKCSDGYDRHRQEWIKNKCDDNAVSKCSATSNDPLSKEDHSSANDPLINTGSVKPISPVINSNDLNANSANQQERLKSKTSNGKEQSKSKGRGGFAFIFILMCLITMIGYWVMYAYRHPTSRPGQFLIKYRVANWKFNNNSDQSRYATEFDSIN